MPTFTRAGVQHTLPLTAYVRSSYAREKHPESEELTALRGESFDAWLQEELSKARLEQVLLLRRRGHDAAADALMEHMGELLAAAPGA